MMVRSSVLPTAVSRVGLIAAALTLLAARCEEPLARECPAGTTREHLVADDGAVTWCSAFGGVP